MCCYNPRDKYKWHFFQIIFCWGSSLASLHQNSGAKVSAGDGGAKKLAINRLRTDHIILNFSYPTLWALNILLDFNPFLLSTWATSWNLSLKLLNF